MKITQLALWGGMMSEPTGCVIMDIDFIHWWIVIQSKSFNITFQLVITFSHCSVSSNISQYNWPIWNVLFLLFFYFIYFSSLKILFFIRHRGILNLVSLERSDPCDSEYVFVIHLTLPVNKWETKIDRAYEINHA